MCSMWFLRLLLRFFRMGRMLSSMEQIKQKHFLIFTITANIQGLHYA